MPLYQFPNVPKFLGVPNIVRSTTIPTSLTSVVGLAAELFGDFLASRWGIYDVSGNLALKPDTFLEVHYKKDERQSNYPVEPGSFASYNKIEMPYDCRVKVAIAQDLSARTAFVAQCQSMLTSINLYTVVTPEITYQNASLVNFIYSRTRSEGLTRIIAELWFMQVRSGALVAPLLTAQPDGADPVSGGTIQTTPLPPIPVLTGIPIPPIGQIQTQ